MSEERPAPAAASAPTPAADRTAVSLPAPAHDIPLPVDPGWTSDDGPPYRIVRPYRVRFEEATAAETIRTAVYLAWLADIAWQHSTLIGFGRKWYSERGLGWLVRAIRLDVLAPIPTYASVLVSTRVLGYRRVAARRECEVRDPDGRPLAIGHVDWVLVNERGMPTRVPPEFGQFVRGEAASFDLHKVALPPTPPDAYERPFHIRRRDLDPMDHVNNSVYLDYFEEALVAAGQGGLLAATPRRYVLDFAASAVFDEHVTGYAWPYERGWAYRLARADGAEMFRATVAAL
jgi:acyl-CoA thioesterase FadM